jgi:6,7-dimethyl-8-ribityllumazine synthase
MATSLKNLSFGNIEELPDTRCLKFGIVVAEWNSDVTFAMRDAAIRTLIKHGVRPDHIHVKQVPGSFELPTAARWMAETEEFDAIICIGCVIQGETRHFDFICQGVTQGIMQLNLTYGLPVIFGLLTTHTLEQAVDRAGGKHGNKGDEAAYTALRMIALKKEID